jgi:hypothetical protein
MKWGRLFIGGHTELTRPVHRVDERLMRRLDEARRQLGEVHVKPLYPASTEARERDGAWAPRASGVGTATLGGSAFAVPSALRQMETFSNIRWPGRHYEEGIVTDHCRTSDRKRPGF